MSSFEFCKAEVLVARRTPFRSLVMAAMRVGDVESVTKLKEIWPDTYNEIQERLNDEKGYNIEVNGQTRLGDKA